MTYMVKFNDLTYQFKKYQIEFEDAAKRVLQSGWYVLGNELELFEKEFAAYSGSKYCVGLNSGLDALILAVKALEIGHGDEVIVPANTYIATILGITANGATPVFIEPDKYFNIDVKNLSEKITNRTKAILAVHLYGQLCDVEELKSFTEDSSIYLIEDCAQGHGASCNGKKSGTFGDIGCFSFFPTKNLGAFGDAGAIITDNKNIAEKIKMFRNYGSRVKYYNEEQGINSRMDELQAALLSVKLKHLDELNNERRKIANYYLNNITNNKIILPKVKKEESAHVFHLFEILSENRNDLIEYLKGKGIMTQIHYPIPPHLADCYKSLGYSKGDLPKTESISENILSLPLYNGMSKEEMEYVVNILNKW